MATESDAVSSKPRRSKHPNKEGKPNATVFFFFVGLMAAIFLIFNVPGIGLKRNTARDYNRSDFRKVGLYMSLL